MQNDPKKGETKEVPYEIYFMEPQAEMEIREPQPDDLYKKAFLSGENNDKDHAENTSAWD